MGEGSSRSRSLLSEPQARRLLATLNEVDRLLSNCEQILQAAESRSLFRKYVADFSPHQREDIKESIRRIQANVEGALEREHLQPGSPSIPATRALHSALTFMQIALEEIRPRHMRQYGEVLPAAAVELESIASELNALVCHLDGYVMPDVRDNKAKVS